MTESGSRALAPLALAGVALAVAGCGGTPWEHPSSSSAPSASAARAAAGVDVAAASTRPCRERGASVITTGREPRRLLREHPPKAPVTLVATSVDDFRGTVSFDGQVHGYGRRQTATLRVGVAPGPGGTSVDRGRAVFADALADGSATTVRGRFEGTSRPDGGSSHVFAVDGSERRVRASSPAQWPAVPVGPGASWRVVECDELAGVPVTITTTIRLRAAAGDRVDVHASEDITADPGRPTFRDGGVEYRVVDVTGGASGDVTSTLATARPAPVHELRGLHVVALYTGADGAAHRVTLELTDTLTESAR